MYTQMVTIESKHTKTRKTIVSSASFVFQPVRRWIKDMNSENDIKLLIGKTIKTVCQTSDEITFVCTDGCAFRAYHMQDCCENVSIHDIW